MILLSFLLFFSQASAVRFITGPASNITVSKSAISRVQNSVESINQEIERMFIKDNGEKEELSRVSANSAIEQQVLFASEQRTAVTKKAKIIKSKRKSKSWE